nr:3-oxoacyl-[acyl-carrier-protein] reductase [uncultured Lachnoclostridium sp.]
MLFDGKTVVVTGGTRGIGRAILMEFAKQGADVAFNYINSANEAEQLVKEIEAMGRKARAFQADVSDSEAVRDMFKEIYETFETVDILVNNAGITRDKALALMGTSEWQQVIDTNLNSVYYCSKAVMVKMMKKRSGKIINISSVSGVIGLPRQCNYSASKAGIIGFTKSIAKEVAAYGINVNAVAPGYINTAMVENLSEEIKQEGIRNIPLGRYGEPEEVAKAVLFLASEHAAYITGHVFPIDGGMSM